MTGHKLFTKQIIQKLRDNYSKQEKSLECLDIKPVVKIFNPYGQGKWLFTELDDDGRLFGLCDLGCGSPELGYVAMDEILSITIKIGAYKLPLERDLLFDPQNNTLSIYTKKSREQGYIVD